MPKEIAAWFAQHIKLKPNQVIVDSIVVREEGKLTMCGVVSATRWGDGAALQDKGDDERTLYLAPAHVFDLDEAFVHGKAHRSISPYAARAHSSAVRDDRDDELEGVLLQHDRRYSQSTTSSRISELAESVSTMPTVYSPYLGRSLSVSTSNAEPFDLDGRPAYQQHGKTHVSPSKPVPTMATPKVRIAHGQPLQLKERVVALLDLAIDSLECAELVLFVDRSDTPSAELQALLRDLAWVGFMPLAPQKVFHTDHDHHTADTFVAVAMQL